MKTNLFKINDLFKIKSGTCTFHATNVHIYKSNGYPYVVRRSFNNGTRGRLNKSLKYANPGNTISFGQDTGTAFYQPNPYFSGRDIKVFVPRKNIFKYFNENIALYLVTAIRKTFKLFTWGTHFNVDTIKKETIRLPILNNGDINLNFMQDKISKIKTNYLTRLRNRLFNKAKSIPVIDRVQPKFIPIRMSKLFKIDKTKSFNKDKLNPLKNTYDYITRTSLNQGVEETTGYIPKTDPNPAGIFSLGLLQMTFFYRNKAWYAGQFVRKITPTFKLNKYTIIYFQTLFNKISPILHAEIVRNVNDKFSNMIIKLPMRNNKLDINYIKNFVNKIKSEQLKRGIKITYKTNL